MDSHALEKQVSFIGSHNYVPIAAEACDWWKEDTTTPRRKLANAGHVCGHGVAEAEGVEGGGEEGTTENRPPGSWASKASLTESIWTTVNRRQPVCWLPLSCIFTGSVPTNTCCPARLSKGASARVFPPRGFFFFLTLTSEKRKKIKRLQNTKNSPQSFRASLKW